ncbi:Zn-ribbon domain-containing OB-fold protein [Salarchaeum sp. JOR-1]|uniref:Zn-ribbon domain-containing OB-fold protein n=1 Tax=Salarchaeum sp. JOR-1 TaxID=2599399 RepID=UPI0011984BBE|nr:Zn-ribbon domain-containing OB-fold protein [Salarchaeum sp. JOR-1]QDX39646.1 Zn-ribbon domain-containing OB-fold protein [Salarchaeum sp. JOR-1]
MNDGHDEFLDAVESGDGYYLECENGHGSLPPRMVCPHCGDRDLTETALPETGTIDSYTVVHVPTPAFADEAPYVTAVADFGPVRLTGRVLADADAVEIGDEVSASVGGADESRSVVFEPR